jgi:maltooligosyltrehalose synthase
MKPELKLPRATYRLQLNRDFTFNQAKEIVPYLAALGISHCYISPFLKARPGSMHGYDIVDHSSLNPEIGSVEDFDGFVATLHEHNMGLILDIVPNHMGVMGSDNAWWLDVLENGEASINACFFDIDWRPLKDELHGKVLVPVLHDHYGVVLESGELKLVFHPERGEFDISYRNHRFPVNPRVYPRILRRPRQGASFQSKVVGSITSLGPCTSSGWKREAGSGTYWPPSIRKRYCVPGFAASVTSSNQPLSDGARERRAALFEAARQSST